MKKTIFAAAAAVLLTATGASAQTSTLLSGYDFQTAPGTAAAQAPNAPSSYISSFGIQAGLSTAALYLDGTHGSSTFITATTGNEVSGFGGTIVNAGTGFSTVTTSPSALALIGGTATNSVTTADGKTAVFTLSMTGFQNLVLTFATQRTTSGFTGNTFSYSTDGVNFTPTNITIVPATSFAVASADFSAYAALNNAATVYIGYTLAGATTATGNNRLDNIQFNATAIPEPSTWAFVAFGLSALGFALRRQVA